MNSGINTLCFEALGIVGIYGLILLMIMNVGAALVYFYYGDWKHGLYWASSVIINLSVTFLK